MKTLYELLGALAEDDADGIRAAFRKAAKANHPDNNPDDLDAGLRFRRIVRANAILSDRRQRETYDRLLAKAVRQRAGKSKRGNFSSQFRTLASGAISSAPFSAASIAIYLLFGYMSDASFIRNRVADAPALAASAGVTMGRAGTRSVAGRPAASDQVSAPASQAEIKQASRHAPEQRPAESGQQEAVKKAEAGPGETISPVGQTVAAAPAAAPDTNTADAEIGGPPHDVVVKDARYYRQRGILAYRSGDFLLALIDFDLAIDLDPNFSDCYVDRAIVHHRMGNLDRALEDVARAKRIDDAKRIGDSRQGQHALSAR